MIGDVKGKDCILIDDIVDSAGTLCNAAAALKENGAKSVHGYVVHGVSVWREPWLVWRHPPWRTLSDHR